MGSGISYAKYDRYKARREMKRLMRRAVKAGYAVPDDPSRQAEVCTLLHAFVTKKSLAVNRRHAHYMLSLNAVELAVQSLYNNVEHSKATRAACLLLAELASNDVDCATRLREMNGGKILDIVLEEHEDDKYITEYIGRIRPILRGQHQPMEVVDRAAMTGNAEELVFAMKSHPEDSVLMEKCIGTIANLAKDGSLFNDLRESGALKQMIRGMLEHSEDAAVQTKACLAVKALAADSLASKFVGSRGGTKAVMDALRFFSAEEHRMLQRHALWALAALTTEPLNLREMKRNNIEELLTEVKERPMPGWGHIPAVLWRRNWAEVSVDEEDESEAEEGVDEDGKKPEGLESSEEEEGEEELIDPLAHVPQTPLEWFKMRQQMDEKKKTDGQVAMERGGRKKHDPLTKMEKAMKHTKRPQTWMNERFVSNKVAQE